MIDLVVCGPDMSGTTTQVEYLTDQLARSGLKVRDLRGTEIDALFHAEMFNHYNMIHTSLNRFTRDQSMSSGHTSHVKNLAVELLVGHHTCLDLEVAAMVKSDNFTYIDPCSADVWLMEEPPRRGAGQICRTLEHYRSALGLEADPVAASHAHAAYRLDEFYRFRKHMRETGRTIIRSRCEESACYQIYDEDRLPNGMRIEDYISLPGHKVAFANPPTDIFIVCGPENWLEDDYSHFRFHRGGGRMFDDYEKDVNIQLLVNSRYASSWMEKLYEIGCGAQGATPPRLHRFDIHHDKETTCKQMHDKLEKLMIQEVKI